MKKSIIQRIWIGFKKGLSMPTLPEEIISFSNKFWVRILRFLGGLSVITLLSGKLNFFPEGKLKLFVLVTCCCLIFLFLIFQSYINYHRIKHMVKTIKEGKLDVRNSPQ